MTKLQLKRLCRLIKARASCGTFCPKTCLKVRKPQLVWQLHTRAPRLAPELAKNLIFLVFPFIQTETHYSAENTAVFAKAQNTIIVGIHLKKSSLARIRPTPKSFTKPQNTLNMLKNLEKTKEAGKYGKNNITD